ncbi:MAG TPA: TrkA family potassium uptake protein [Chloroflexota bacterium]|nr:TrkA family potassium uptake protein [Chloroflexota bacterium]
MRIVIVGCGRVGAELSTDLSIHGHEVAVIDREPAAFSRLGRAFKGKTVTGIGFDRDVLLESGVDRADAFASVTSGDNTNIVSAMIARNVFRVPKIVARIADPQRAEIYRRLGIPTISPTIWGANEIRELLITPDLTSRFTFGSGEVELIQFHASSRMAGYSVADLTSPSQFSVVSIVRGGRAFLPTAGSQLEEGDLVYVASEAGSLPKLEEIIRA